MLDSVCLSCDRGFKNRLHQWRLCSRAEWRHRFMCACFCDVIDLRSGPAMALGTENTSVLTWSVCVVYVHVWDVWDELIHVAVAAIEQSTAFVMTSSVYVHVWDEIIFIPVAVENREHQFWWCHRFMCTSETKAVAAENRVQHWWQYSHVEWRHRFMCARLCDIIDLRGSSC